MFETDRTVRHCEAILKYFVLSANKCLYARKLMVSHFNLQLFKNYLEEIILLK